MCFKTAKKVLITHFMARKGVKISVFHRSRHSLKWCLSLNMRQIHIESAVVRDSDGNITVAVFLRRCYKRDGRCFSVPLR